MRKPAKLSVHKNNREQRERKRRRAELVRDAKRLTRGLSDIDGYVVVAWNKDCDAQAYWESDRVPGSLVGDMAKRTVERIINRIDWRIDLLDE